MDKTPTLLGLMSGEPTHGYDLKQRYDSLFGVDKPIAFGQIYSTLARMIRDGLIVALGEEAGGGPDRKRYAVTPEGTRRVREWLATPDESSATLQSNLFAKTVLALLLDDDAEATLDIQRHALLARMRALTQSKQHASLLDSLAIDHSLFVIEADLRWIDMTGARLSDLKREVKDRA